MPNAVVTIGDVPLEHRQRHGERAAGAGGAGQRDPAGVCLHDAFDQAQAESRPLDLGGNDVGGAIEGVEDPRLVRRGDADAAIADADVERGAA